MCDECWCLTGLDKEGRPAALGGQVQVITELISDAVFKKLLWQMSSFCQGLNSSFAGREEESRTRLWRKLSTMLRNAEVRGG